MFLNENVFNTGKNYSATKIFFFHEKTLAVDVKEIPSTTKKIVLGRKNQRTYFFSLEKNYSATKILFFMKKRLPSTSKNSLLNYAVGLFTIKQSTVYFLSVTFVCRVLHCMAVTVLVQ